MRFSFSYFFSYFLFDIWAQHYISRVLIICILGYQLKERITLNLLSSFYCYIFFCEGLCILGYMILGTIHQQPLLGGGGRGPSPKGYERQHRQGPCFQQRRCCFLRPLKAQKTFFLKYLVDDIDFSYSLRNHSGSDQNSNLIQNWKNEAVLFMDGPLPIKGKF